MKVYCGFIREKQYVIQVVENNISRQLSHKKPLYTEQFCWGHGGKCASETAFAILSDCLGKRKGERLYHQFKWDVVANLWGNWNLSEQKIMLWAESVTKKLIEKRLMQGGI